MVPHRSRPVSLVVVLTLALVGTLAGAGSILLAALDGLYANQLRDGLLQDAGRRADYLEQTFSRMLWNFAMEEVTAVGEAVIRDEVVLGLTVRTEVGKIVFQQTKAGPAFVSLTRTLAFGGTKVGDFTLVLSGDPLERQHMALAGAALGAFLSLLALLSVATPFLLNRTVLKPFSRLVKALVGNPGSGPFPNLPEPSSRIRELRTFETALVSLNRAVVQQVDELETRVDARTRQLREAQDLLVRTETMATLGQLAAGIAHELNTPLGAISSSTRYVQNELTDVLIPRLAEDLALPEGGDPQKALLEVARLAADLEEFPGTSVRKALKKRWTEKGGRAETALFDLVTTTGLSALLDDLVVWSRDARTEKTIELVAQWSHSLAIVGLASEKAASVVSALRAQVQPGSPNETKLLNLRREIDQALALLQNKIKRGVKVELKGREAVWVLGDPNELGKVWLNLMLNAVQAMDGAGTLTIDLSTDGDRAKAEFRDTGPGILESILPRIFEPFFTTKPTGMGLGLEISRRIVEQHRGTVEVESQPGRTVFRVILPARPEP